MLVSHRSRFIYLKTRKTAGTSILAYLEPYCMPAGEPVPDRSTSRPAIESAAGIIGFYEPSPSQPWWNHMPAAEVKARLGSTWDDYAKVCCIRNPFDKVFSFFWWNHQSFALERPGTAEVKAKFRAWLRTDEDLARDREMYTVAGAPCIDRYIRYETLLPDLEDFCRWVGIAFEPSRLGRHKGQVRPPGLPFRDFYDRESGDRVLRAYEQEFEWFGYSPEWR